MRTFVAVLLAAGLAAACSPSPESAARADAPATATTTLPHADVAPSKADPHGGAMPGDPHGGAMPGNPHGGGPKADDVPLAKVAKAPGPDGRTVAEVYAQRQALHDKPVVVRGTVVKALSGIMGRNWVHVRDGSGTASAGDNDLTLTTQQTVAVGDVVLAKGTARAEKDFGSGYKYGVIVEDATFEVEKP